MTDAFKWRHYESEIILTCVRWYLRYSLSYRDLEEMMTEQGLLLDHTTFSPTHLQVAHLKMIILFSSIGSSICSICRS